MGSGISDGLRHQHQQGFNSEQDTQARYDKTPSGLNPEDESKDPEKAFVSTNPNGNLYNTENDKPVMPDVQMTETGSNRKERDLKRLDRVKLNDHIAYSFGQGTVVGKNNMYVQIANDDTQHIDIVPIGETYFPEDKISAGNIVNEMWDLMVMQTRSTLLNKINIVGEVQKAYLYRDWDDMPTQVKDLLTDKASVNYYDAPPHGGVEGREPDHSGRNEESRSYRDIIEPKHVTRPVDDPQAPGTRKSDVEHGTYGGVVTDTPIDATDEYEDERPKKPLSGSEDELDGAPSGVKVEHPRSGLSSGPKDPKKYPSDPKWNETQKDLDLASITGEGDKKKEEDEDKVEKDEDSGVRPESAGFKGAQTNAQASEKGELPQAAITGKPDLESTHKEHVEWGTQKEEKKTDGPEHGKGPQHTDKAYELNIVNKHTTRWGIRQASDEDIKRLMES